MLWLLCLAFLLVVCGASEWPKEKKYLDSNISEELQLKFLENYRDESYPLEVVSSILLNRSTALLFQCA